MKICFKCGVSKKYSEFYRHPAMGDGHLGKCKECTKQDVRENRKDRINYYRYYDKKRHQLDGKVKQRKQEYASTEDAIIKQRKYRADWLLRNPEKAQAYKIVRNALRSGKLIKPKNCVQCGNIPIPRNLHAHHEDYNKPLDVEWKCVWCHAKEHYYDLEEIENQFLGIKRPYA